MRSALISADRFCQDTPPLPASINKQIKSMYQHFATRLKERYGLDITPLEYIDLIQMRYESIDAKIAPGRKKVKIIFKGTIVIAIKQSTGNRLLITALPRTGGIANTPQP